MRGAASVVTLGDQAALARAEEALFGKRRPVKLGRYMVLERIGRGAFGTVYRAFDPKLDRAIALKVVTGQTVAGEEGRERLLREARAQAQVRHPNVAEVYDTAVLAHTDEEAQVVIAMELIEGTDLRKWLVRNRDEATILDRLVASARGLAAAHARGLVHRDFKPDNVLVGTDGRVKVVDFGLARLELPSDPPRGAVDIVTPLARSHSGKLRGTPLYMAPEVFAGRPATPQSDQFSFCVTLHEALLGHRPFYGKNVHELSANVTAGRLAKELPASLPDAAARVLRRGLSVEPNDRFADMDALIAELEARPRRRRWPYLVAGLGVAGLLGAFVSQRDDPLSRCLDSAQLQSIWNAEREAEVAGAMRATKAVYADETLQRVLPLLDGYAERWRAVHGDACRQLVAPDSVGLADRQLSCLDRRARNFDKLVGVLADADRGTVERAVEAAMRLPPLDACLDAASLDADPDPPEAPAVARRVELLRDDLAKVSALTESGRYEESTRLARRVVMAAGEEGYPPVEAEAHLAHARALLGLGEAADAARMLETAYFTGVRGGVDAVARDAAIALVALVGETLDDPPGGLGWARHAQAYVELGGGTDSEARFYGARALALRSAGRWDDAVDDHERALGIFEALYGAKDVSYASALADAATTYSTQGQYERALEAAEQALELERELRGPRHPALVGFNLEAGLNLYRMGEPAKAVAYYEAAREIGESALEEDHPALGPVYEALAHTYKTLGRSDEVTDLMRRALRIAQRRGAPVIEVAAARRGLAQMLWIVDNDTEAAIAQLVLARDELERSGRTETTAYSNVMREMTRCELTAVRADRAHLAGQAAVRAAREAGTPALTAAWTMEVAGAAALEAGAVDEAEALFAEVRDIRQAATARKDRRISVWRWGLARVALVRGQVKAARLDLADLLEDKELYLPSWALSAAQVTLAEALMAEGKKADAETLARMALETAKRSRVSEAIWLPRATALLGS